MKLVTVAVPVEVIQPGAVTQEQDVRFSAKILTEYWLDAKRPEKSAAHALGMDGFRAGRGAKEISHFSVHTKRADQMS